MPGSARHKWAGPKGVCMYIYIYIYIKPFINHNSSTLRSPASSGFVQQGQALRLPLLSFRVVCFFTISFGFNYEPFPVRFSTVRVRYGSLPVRFLHGSVPTVPVSRFAVWFYGHPV